MLGCAATGDDNGRELANTGREGLSRRIGQPALGSGPCRQRRCRPDQGALFPCGRRHQHVWLGRIREGLGGDLATLLASRYSCPALEATPVVTTPAPPSPVVPAPGAPSTPPRPEAAPLVRAPSNLTGICDRGIQAKINGALDGSLSIDSVIAAVEPRLWAMSAVFPIMQDTTIVAVGPSVRNVSLTGAIPVGIVADAGNWMKAPR